MPFLIGARTLQGVGGGGIMTMLGFFNLADGVLFVKLTRRTSSLSQDLNHPLRLRDSRATTNLLQRYWRCMGSGDHRGTAARRTSRRSSNLFLFGASQIGFD